MQIRLYQSTKHSAETILAAMLQKILDRQGKALVRCAAADSAKSLSDFLWQKDGFIPHGIAGQDAPAHQPIWLSHQGQGKDEGESDNPIAADNLFLWDGLLPHIEAHESDAGFADVILPFGENPQVLEKMRDFWRDVQDKAERQTLPHVKEIAYWHYQDGKWQAAELSRARI